jgi:hypothetical protein
MAKASCCINDNNQLLLCLPSLKRAVTICYLSNENNLLQLNFKHMKTTNKILIALGAGAVIGGVLGILFAPDKGVETRKKLADTGNRLTDAVKTKFTKGKEKLSELNTGIKEKINGLNEKLEELA